MPNSKFLSSLRDSETVTCQQCRTVQFQRDGTCIRCHKPLSLEYLNLEIETLLGSCSEDAKKHLARSIGDLLRTLRKRRGLCQSQLAAKAAGCITRSNLSRAECGRTLLPLNKLLLIAKALGLKAVILRFETATPRRTHSLSARG